MLTARWGTVKFSSAERIGHADEMLADVLPWTVRRKIWNEFEAKKTEKNPFANSQRDFYRGAVKKTIYLYGLVLTLYEATGSDNPKNRLHIAAGIFYYDHSL